MAFVSKTRSYSTSQQLTATFYNDDRDEIIAGVNSINNAQIAADAGIAITKLADIDTDGTLTANSDSKLATQKATKTYVTTAIASIPIVTNGWTADTHTWIFASANSFTIAAVDLTEVFTVGTRLKWTDSGGIKKGVVASSIFSTDTTVNIATNNDFVIANSAITAPYYSYAANPAGYPGWFNWSPTIVGFSANPTNTVYRFNVISRTCQIMISQDTDGTSNSATFTISLPLTCATNNHAQYVGFCYVHNNGAAGTPAQYSILSGESVVNIFKDADGNGFATSGGKRCIGINIAYEI